MVFLSRAAIAYECKLLSLNSQATLEIARQGNEPCTEGQEIIATGTSEKSCSFKIEIAARMGDRVCEFSEYAAPILKM